MIDLNISRCSVVRRGGDVDEYLVHRLSSVGDDLDLGSQDVWLNVRVTDSPSITYPVAFDGLAGSPLVEAAPVGSHAFLIGIRLRGSLRRGESRAVGLHVTRHGAAEVWDAHAWFQDLAWVGSSFDPLGIAELSFDYTVVLPELDSLSESWASGADEITSRTVTWHRAPTLGWSCRFSAGIRSAHVLLPVDRVDDQIAFVYESIGRDACGLSVDWRALEAGTRAALTERHCDLSEVARDLSLCCDLSAEARQERLLNLLGFLRSLRQEVSRSGLTTEVTDDVGQTVRMVLAGARRLLEQNEVRTPVPADLRQVLLMLAQYLESVRAEGPSAWSADPDEKELHKHLRSACRLRMRVEDELPTGPGRLDLLIGDVPVELKAVELGRSPDRSVNVYVQQAADYASLRGAAIGILLVLDKTDRNGEVFHSPPLSRMVRVDAVESRQGVSGVGCTVVVAMSIDAKPPLPSSLRGDRGR